jgi:long-chain fatty acid transport protein
VRQRRNVRRNNDRVARVPAWKSAKVRAILVRLSAGKRRKARRTSNSKSKPGPISAPQTTKIPRRNYMQATPFSRTLLSAALGGALAVGSSSVFASAFMLVETTVSGLGNAYAGAAATADEAGTIWWNPAGMTRLNGISVTSTLHAISPSAKFQDQGSQAACVSAAVCRPLGSNGGDAGDLAFVPNFYVAIPMGRLALGLGVSGPFGLKTEYDPEWLGRYQAIKSDVKTVNINPAFAYKINDMFSIGGGANFQKIDAELTNRVNPTAVSAQALQAGVIPAALGPQVLGASLGIADIDAKVKGDDSAWGWNFGVLMQVAPATRIGAHYRSSIKYRVEGDVSFNVPTIPVTSLATGALNQVFTALQQPGQRLSSGPVYSDIKLPDTFSLSLAHDVNPQLQVLADVSWTGWSSIPKLEFTRTNGTVLNSVEYNWNDTWRYSVGANYKLNDRVTLRTGLAFDESPMDTAHRTPRLPDGDRTWLSLGAKYMISPATALDFGYTHIWVKDPKIDNRNDGSTAGFGLINGTYDSNVNIFSVGLSHSFR